MPASWKRVNKLEREQDALHAKSVDETVAESRGRALAASRSPLGHWDELNVLAHVRFNDRTIDGKKPYSSRKCRAIGTSAAGASATTSHL